MVAEPGQDLGAGRRRRLGGHQLDRPALDGQGVGLAGGVPDVAGQAVVEHPGEHRVGPGVGARDGLPDQGGGGVRVAALEGVLGRPPQELDPGGAGQPGRVGDLVPDPEGLLVVVAALGEGEDPLRRPPGLDPAAQGPGRVAGLVPVVGELGGGGGLAGGAELGARSSATA